MNQLVRIGFPAGVDEITSRVFYTSGSPTNCPDLLIFEFREKIIRAAAR